MHSLGSSPRSLRNLDRRGEQLRENIDLNTLKWLRAWERGRVVYRQQESGKEPEQERDSTTLPNTWCQARYRFRL